jgi:hypothetical protein
MNEAELVDAVLSGDYFVGGESNDYVGADAPRKVKSGPGMVLRLVCPISSAATIAQNGTADCAVTVQRDMRVDRFAVAASLSANFLINNLQGAMMPLFVSSGALHADLLSSAAFGVSLTGWTIGKGTTITCNVTQLGATAIKFYAGIFGPTEF